MLSSFFMLAVVDSDREYARNLPNPEAAHRRAFAPSALMAIDGAPSARHPESGAGAESEAGAKSGAGVESEEEQQEEEVEEEEGQEEEEEIPGRESKLP